LSKQHIEIASLFTRIWTLVPQLIVSRKGPIDTIKAQFCRNVVQIKSRLPEILPHFATLGRFLGQD